MILAEELWLMHREPCLGNSGELWLILSKELCLMYIPLGCLAGSCG